jgi:hypothetical protein
MKNYWDHELLPPVFFPKYKRSECIKQYLHHLGSEVLTAVVMKNSVYWGIASCSPLKASQCFGRTCRLHLQGRRICQTRNQCDVVSKQIYVELVGYTVGELGLLPFMFLTKKVFFFFIDKLISSIETMPVCHGRPTLNPDQMRWFASNITSDPDDGNRDGSWNVAHF